MVEVTQEKLLAGARNLKAKGYTPQQVDAWLQTHNSSLDAMKQFVATQKAKADQMAKEWRERAKPTTAGDKVAEFMVTNPYARQAGFALQGISNAGLNPAGYVARAAGMDTRPLEAQNAAERITELAGQYGYDAAAMATGLSGLAEAGVGGAGVGGNVIKALAEGGMPLAETSALGSAVLTGGVNPQSTFGRILTDTAGGVLAPATAAKMTQLPRSLSAAGKAVKDAFSLAPESENIKNLREIKKLKRNINTESLDEAMAEAERTGRSAIEVGDDAVVQAAQMARQQTPEARQIITKNLQDILEAQKARTRGVIDENLGTKGKTTVADVVEAAKKKAAPLYKDIENMEDLAKYETRDLPQQNFNRWNAGNTIVDENGQPLDLYHGTRANFDAFDISKAGQSNGGISKIGFWLTPEKQIAKEFSNTWYGGNKPRVIQTYVNMKNPKVYKSVDNTNALKKIESDINNVKNKMQEIKGKMSNSDLSQLRGFMQYDDYDEVAKMYGYSSETAKNARNYWDFDKQLDDLLFEERVLKANDSYDQLMNDLDEYSEFVQHIDGVKDFRRGSHISRIAIKNPDEAVAKLKERLKKEGYDGIIIENTNRDTDVIGKNATQYIAFEPNQIKSVKNSGAWSESPSLTDAGWTPESQSELAKVIQDNDVFADAVKNIKRAYSSLKGLPDTDPRVVMEARKLLSKQTIGNDPTLAYQAKQTLKEIDPIINKVTEGKLEQANKIYENAYKFEKAADMGRDVFNNRQSIEEFKQNLKKLSAGEKDAVKIGVRDEMVNKLGAAYNENITNKKFLVDNTRQKLKAILGKQEGDAVIDEAEQAYKLTQNANRVLSGSQTAEKSGLRDRLQGIRRFVRNPIDTTIDTIAAPFDNYNNVRLANALTNPNLAKVYNQMRLQQIIAQATQPQKINYMPYLLAAENYANQ